MSVPPLVCPDEPALIERLHGRTLVVRVDDPAAIAGAARRVRASDNQLACVICEVPGPLAAVAIADDWLGVPIALGAPEAGRFRDLAPAIPRLRELDLRVTLPAARPDNLVALRLLASLGVAGCAELAGDPPDWAALTDLMTYALLGTVPHAPIDPFDYIADHYEPDRATGWAAASFDDRSCYVHVDGAGRFDDEGPAAERAARSAWRRSFFERDRPCARCPGWRVCQGAFADPAAAAARHAPACAGFFVELLDVVDQRQARAARDQETPRWRP